MKSIQVVAPYAATTSRQYPYLAVFTPQYPGDGPEELSETLQRFRESFTVLFTEPEKGVIVGREEDACEQLGHFFHGWAEEAFTPLPPGYGLLLAND